MKKHNLDKQEKKQSRALRALKKGKRNLWQAKEAE
jgi:hypothetical protein